MGRPAAVALSDWCQQAVNVVERPESPVQIKHSVGYVQDNYDRTHLTYVMSGDDLALMRAGEQRWPLPQPEHLKKKHDS